MPKILIADDSAILRQQLKNDLVSAGHDVIEAEDGSEAFEKLEEETRFDLIIFDINMPGLSGIEVLRRRKEKSLQQGALVFLLTTDSTAELKIEAKELGVTAWITKPYQKDSLLAVIEKVL